MAHAQISHTSQTLNLAQTLPPPPRTGPYPLPEPQNSRQLPPPYNLLQQPMAPSPPTKETAPSVTDTITVKQFRFIGNTAFTARQLSPLVARFTNRPITFAELLSARTAITNFYLQHGFINCGALIPANQVFRGGIITIQVVEGRVEAIEVTGTKRLSPNYVRARLKRATSQPLNRDRLLKALQLLKLNPLIKNRPPA